MKTKLIILGILINSVIFGQEVEFGSTKASSSEDAITKEDTTGSSPEIRSAHDVDSLYESSKEGIFIATDPAYGAKGDGVTDNLEEIQATIDSATSAKGMVYLPEGTYIISGRLYLKSNIRFCGAGQGITIIKASSSWPPGSADKPMIDFEDDANNITIENLTIDGNKSAFTSGTPRKKRIYGIYPYGVSINNITIRNVEVMETSAWGIAISGSSDIQIIDCYIHECGDTLVNSGVFASDITNFLFENNIVDSCYHQALYDLSGNGHIISNSKFRYNESGGLDIRVDSNAVVVGNLCAFNKNGHGMNIVKDPVYAERTRSLTITGNNIRQNKVNAGSNPAQIQIYNTQDVLFANNNIEAYNPGSSSAYGIFIDLANDNLTIDGNTIISPNGIYLEQDSLNNIIIRNNFISNRSDIYTEDKLGYGIYLRNSDVTSDGIYVLDNVIDSCDYGIYVHSGWHAYHTIIRSNKIKAFGQYPYYDISTSLNRFYAPEYETRKVKIGRSGVSNKDYNFTAPANETAQTLTLTGYIPPYSRIVSIEMRCITTLAGSGATDMNWWVGSTSGSNEFIESTDLDDAADVRGIIKNVTVNGQYNTSGDVYITADPVGANWDTFTGGAWIIFITYLKTPGSLY